MRRIIAGRGWIVPGALGAALAASAPAQAPAPKPEAKGKSAAGGAAAAKKPEAPAPNLDLPPADLLAEADAAFGRKEYDPARVRYQVLLNRHYKDPAVSRKKKDIEKRLADCEKALGMARGLQGAFHGKVEQVGKDGIRLTYDFDSEEELKDFGRMNGVMKTEVAGGELELTCGGYGFLTIKDAPFQGSVSVEADATIVSGGTELGIGAFLNEDVHGWYFFSVNYREYLGDARRINVIRKWQGEKTHNLASGSKPEVMSGVKYRLKAVVAGGMLQLAVNNATVETARDATFSSGLALIGGYDGTLKFDRIKVEGKVPPEWLKKQISEAATIARREKETDLKSSGGPRLVRIEPVSAESKECLAAVPAAARAGFEKGRERQMIGDAEGALKEFDKVLNDQPGFPAAYYRRGLCRETLGESQEAAADLSRAIELSPKFPEALKARAESLVGLGRLADAENDLARALEAKPDYAGAYAARGYLRFLEDDLKQAQADVKKALSLRADDPDAKSADQAIRHLVNGPPWGKSYTKETANYVVRSNISQAKADFYAAHLEAIRDFYETCFGSRGAPKKKSRVYIFDTKEAYQTYAELTTESRAEFTLGYYHPQFRELYLFEDLDVGKTLRVLYHEGFHQFLHLLIAKPPYWFNEGTAEYFGATRIEGGKVAAAGLMQEGRLKNIQYALRGGGSFGFAKILNETPRQFYSGDVGTKYAQAWSMVHFFIHGAGGRYKPFLLDYYQALRDGKTQKGAYEASFGKAPMGTMEGEWRKYVEGLK